MINSNSLIRKMFAGGLLTAMLVTVLCVHANAALQQPEPPEWKRAWELYEAQNFVAALPLLEKSALAQPENPQILGALGFALAAVSKTEKDPELRKKMRDRALKVLRKSQSHGDDSNLTQITLDALSQDEVTLPSSRITAAEAATREGEAAFVRGDFDAAMASYKRALELDPKLYEAALYAGDVQFKKGYLAKDPKVRSELLDEAGIWFARAIDIEANRETAYRYWGDALDLQGKTEEARDKFIEAIIAEPGNQRPYMGLKQWGDRHSVRMGHPNIVIPNNVAPGKGGNVSIVIDEKSLKGDNEGTAVWLMYGMARAAWMPGKNGPSEKFSKAYPGETTYRHSLAEEVEALRMAASVAERQEKEKKVTSPDPSLANLVRLNQAGLLEPYVFFARVDEGIARDYEAYRRSNRDKLRRYWSDIVILKN